MPYVEGAKEPSKGTMERKRNLCDKNMVYSTVNQKVPLESWRGRQGRGPRKEGARVRAVGALVDLETRGQKGGSGRGVLGCSGGREMLGQRDKA